ncbi:hypothetical protein BpHYR1_043243 [Brachionus plicatilis]|uniref:Uncharacterized protein n=1 Tax=Brachionus plicatilis TaxID=10195 RepID=A0A3M7R2Q4_BRAPC|nr:hypothetical protein BpHYR1_043243 [Brachionus plicatilis]
MEYFGQTVNTCTFIKVELLKMKYRHVLYRNLDEDTSKIGNFFIFIDYDVFFNDGFYKKPETKIFLNTNQNVLYYTKLSQSNKWIVPFSQGLW